MRMHHMGVAIGFALFAQGVPAEDFTYEFIACTHLKQTMLEANSDIVAFGLESWGSVASSTTPTWENASTHCVGYVHILAGKRAGKGVCKWTLVTGDTGVGEFEFSSAGEPTWNWLSGTGKLKGITGSGTFRHLPPGKPAAAGTSQGCRRDWGKYTLP